MTLERYVRSIRNMLKRDYARAYIAWVRDGGRGAEPSWGELSFMAAQAVRLNVRDFLKAA
jgi:hypothetical protein